jgi:ABC-type branched-subunit amino acid transport system substrate-binding protein
MGCVLVVSAAACSSSGSGSSSKSIELGTTNVLTGSIASVCKPITDGARAVFDSVNASGGIRGHKIKYTVLDDAYDPARAAANARKLVADHVAAVVGGCGTANLQAAYTVTSRSKIPMIGPYADLSSLESPATDNFYGLFPSYGEQDGAAIGAGVKKYGAGSVLHIAQNSAGVKDEDKVAQAAAEKVGASWSGTELADPTTTDYTPLALRVKAKHPDFILISAGDAQAAQILLALKAQGVVPGKAYLTNFASTTTLLSTAGSVLNGHAVGVVSPKISAADTASCEALIAKYAGKADDNNHGVYGCSVAQVVVSALRKVKGDVTSASIAKALDGLTGDTSAPAFGPVTFSGSDHGGVTTGTTFIVTGGKFVVQGTEPYKA